MRILLAALAVCFSMTASAQTAITGNARPTAQLAGDAAIALACKIRTNEWFTVAIVAIKNQVGRSVAPVRPRAGTVPNPIERTIVSAQDSGKVEYQRFGQEACAAIQRDGSLALIDALIAGMNKPG